MKFAFTITSAARAYNGFMTATMTGASPAATLTTRTAGTDGDADAVNVAHLLRRIGFGPAPGEVERAGAYVATLDAALAQAHDDGAEMPDANDDDDGPPLRWWLRRMRGGDSPLYDKMVLFWHSHLPSSVDKANADMLVRQHNIQRRHALGNFRELLHAVITDAAMLVFLDAAGSKIEAPNENLAREIMELFTLGHGTYTEDDVRAGARALSGFTVDWDSEAVGIDEEEANHSRLTILGVTDTFDAAGFLDLLCDQAACAPFVAGRLYRYFVGVDATAERCQELGDAFRSSGLEIRPLVEDILRGADFLEHRYARPRFPVEWFVAARLAQGLDIVADDIWILDELGQLPFHPPNVAGWPAGPQWAGAGRQLLRSSIALDGDVERIAIDFSGGGHATPDERVDAALRHCGLFEVSASTRAGLAATATRVSVDDGGDHLLLMLALASPEASCC